MPATSLLLTPLDVVIFRDSRPFGQVATATGSQFPNPRTAAGAVRAWLLAQAGHRPQRKDGIKRTNTAMLEANCPADVQWVLGARFRGPLICRAGKALYPAPLHLVVADKAKHDRFADVYRLVPCDASVPGWTPPAGAPARLRPLWVENAAGSEWSALEDARFATHAAMTRALRGDGLDMADFVPQAELLGTEYRLGIGMDSDRNATKKGLLYAAEYHRPTARDIGFRIDVETAADVPLAAKLAAAKTAQPWLRLGGEGRRAGIRVLEPEAHPAAPEAWPPPSGRFFTCLATPGMFRHGAAFPAGFSQRFELCGAITGSPHLFSGWDVPMNRPTKTFAAVRAGAVHFWELRDGVDPGPDPHGTCIGDYVEYNAAGWGLALRGAW